MDRGDVAAQGVSSHLRPVSKKKAGREFKGVAFKIANYKPPTLLRVTTVYATEYSGAPRSTPVRQSVARVQAVISCLLLPSI